MRPTAYRRNARGLRDRQAFERIRMQAGALFAAGHQDFEQIWLNKEERHACVVEEGELHGT